MLWTWTHNGFHGPTRLVIRVPAGSKAGDQVRVSRAVARRLDHAVCGMWDCHCGEAVTHEISGAGLDASGHPRHGVILPAYGGTMRGHYTQD